jgi:hypothetical protein
MLNFQDYKCQLTTQQLLQHNTSMVQEKTKSKACNIQFADILIAQHQLTYSTMV